MSVFVMQTLSDIADRKAAKLVRSWIPNRAKGNELDYGYLEIEVHYIVLNLLCVLETALTCWVKESDHVPTAHITDFIDTVIPKFNKFIGLIRSILYIYLYRWFGNASRVCVSYFAECSTQQIMVWNGATFAQDGKVDKMMDVSTYLMKLAKSLGVI